MGAPSSSADRDRPALIDRAHHPLPTGYRESAVDPTPAASTSTESASSEAAPEARPGTPAFQPADALDATTDQAPDLLADDEQRARPGTELWRRARHEPVRLVVLGLALAVLACSVVVGSLLFRDARRTYSSPEVVAALQSFRSPAGRTQSDATGGWQADLTVSPAPCAPLITQALDGARDTAAWTTTDGTGGQPVRLVAARFDNPVAARRVFAELTDQAPQCSRVLIGWRQDQTRWVQIEQVSLTEGPFSTRKELTYTVRSRFGGLVYVRSYGNTVMMVSGTDQARTGQRLTDDLIAALQRPTAG